jgi:hypothetical protein
MGASIGANAVRARYQVLAIRATSTALQMASRIAVPASSVAVPTLQIDPPSGLSCSGVANLPLSTLQSRGGSSLHRSGVKSAMMYPLKIAMPRSGNNL